MKKFIIILISLILLAALTMVGINLYVVLSEKSKIKTVNDLKNVTDMSCIVILGVDPDGDGMSDMLKDRLDVGIELYKSGAAPKILMSGDGSISGNNGVSAMKKYAADNGVPDDDVFADEYGLSVYDGIYRARTIYGAEKFIIVSQQYQLYRALHIANRLGVEAYGVSADLHSYDGQFGRELKEFWLRDKDFVVSLYKPSPEHLGDPIPLRGVADAGNGSTPISSIYFTYNIGALKAGEVDPLPACFRSSIDLVPVVPTFESDLR